MFAGTSSRTLPMEFFLLSQPIVEKETCCGSNYEGSAIGASVSLEQRLMYGASSMQGRRRTMEDAHICQPQVLPHLPDHALFAVFDGHGGAKAAEFASNHFGRILEETPAFQTYRQHVAPDITTTNDDQHQKQHHKRTKLQTKSNSGANEYYNISKDYDALTLLLHTAMTQAVVALDCELLAEAISLDLTTETLQSAKEPTKPTDNDEHSKELKQQATISGTQHAEAASKGEAPSSQDSATPGPESDSSTWTNDGSGVKIDEGSTATIVLVTPTLFVCANLGDSRAVLGYYCDSPTPTILAKPLSIDHKPYLEAEKERIEKAGGTVANSRVDGQLTVSRALGDFDLKGTRDAVTRLYKPLLLERYRARTTIPVESCSEGNGNLENSYAVTIAAASLQKVSPVPEIFMRKRNPEMDEFVMVACDGIWDVLSNQQCVDLISRIFSEGERNLGLVCEEVMDVCLKKDSNDNMTVILASFPGNPKSPKSVGLQRGGGGVMNRRRFRGYYYFLNDRELAALHARSSTS